MANKALTNARVLDWAIRRSGLPHDGLADRLRVSPDTVAAWARGDERPTFRQAQKLARALYIPFGYLFLPEPPVEEPVIPDLRTVGSNPHPDLDVNFRNLLDDVLFKHDWYKEHLEEQGAEELPFVGKFAIEGNPKAIASDIRETLFGKEDDRARAQTWEDRLRQIMTRAEGVGIWVMRNGVVGSNTQRRLSVQQFRGFAISDPIAPLIFINGQDAKAAQIFTLSHELAHIWLGESGISNVFLGKDDYGVRKNIEKVCNRVAGEFLVPEEELHVIWRRNETLDVNADRLSRHFKVSRVVVGRRAFDCGLVDDDAYRTFFVSEARRWKKGASEGSGGDFYRTLPIRNGQRFTRSVVGEAMSGRLLLRDAASLLNTQPVSVVNYFRKQIA